MQPVSDRLPLHVEFIGLPGTGKSTVRHLVVKRLTAEGLRCYPKEQDSLRSIGGVTGSRSTRRAGRPTAARRIRYVRQHMDMWRVAVAAYHYLLREGRISPNRLRMVRTLLHSLDRIGVVCRRSADEGVDVVVQDQGFAAYLRQMMADSTPSGERRWARVAAGVAAALPPTRYLAVVFDLDPETAVARVRSRNANLGRWDRMSPSRALSELTPQARRLDALVESLRVAGALDGVLHVDGTRSPEQIAAAICDHIAAQLAVATPVARPPQRDGGGETGGRRRLRHSR